MLNKPLLIVLLLITIGVNAQNFQGKAYYTSKTSIDLANFGRPNMSEEQKKRMKERLKRMFQKTFILNFNREASVYKEEEKLEAPNPNQGRRFGALLSGAVDGIIYKNIKTKEMLIAHELFGKAFKVVDTLPKLEWKITGETKQIGRYLCVKATATKTWEDFNLLTIRRAAASENRENKKKDSIAELPMAKEIEAWYTTQIPVNQGPDKFWGLPGLILEISTGETTILCSKIVVNPKEKLTIKAPSKGKAISQKAYEGIAIKKYQEMRANFRRQRGGQGRR